jgi:hypothetical protein
MLTFLLIGHLCPDPSTIQLHIETIFEETNGETHFRQKRESNVHKDGKKEKRALYILAKRLIF